jgi:hypothetical protein
MPGLQKTQHNNTPQKNARLTQPEKPRGQKVDPQQMLEAPETLNADDVLAAQQTLGNQVVQCALDKNAKREDSTDEQGNLLPEITDAIDQARGGGSSLPDEIQDEAKKSLGRSFKDVRLHTGDQADEISRRIRARAFTIGKDIFFKKGAYAPGSGQGRETLIHELTHVVQQSGSRSSGGKLKLGERGNTMEQQADQMGKKAAQSLSKSSGAQVQRMQVEEEEELQMQAEEEEMLQMQPVDEEELQMQSVEEEELQMADDDDDWETDSEPTKSEPPPTPSQMKAMSSQLVKQMAQKPEKREPKDQAEPEKPEKEEAGSKLESMNPKSRLKVMLDQKDKAREAKGTALKEIEGKSKQINSGSEDQKSRLNALEEKNQQQIKSFYKSEQKAGTSGFLNESIAKKKSEEQAEAKQKAVSENKDKWLKTLRDPNASSADIANAKKRLETLHKGSVSKKDFEAAKKERQAALQDAAKSGDEKAFEKIETEKAAEEDEKKKNPSKLKMFGQGAAKFGLGLLKSQGKDGLKHFLGVDPDKDDDDDDEKDDKKDKKKGKGGSGGGDGGGAAVGVIMEKYAEVVEENKKLKAQLEKKEKAA